MQTSRPTGSTFVVVSVRPTKVVQLPPFHRKLAPLVFVCAYRLSGRLAGWDSSRLAGALFDARIEGKASRLWNQGDRPEDIAEAVGLSKTGVYLLRSKHPDLFSPRVQPREHRGARSNTQRRDLLIQVVVRLRNCGVNMPDISKIVGHPVGSLSAFRRVYPDLWTKHETGSAAIRELDLSWIN